MHMTWFWTDSTLAVAVAVKWVKSEETRDQLLVWISSCSQQPGQARPSGLDTVVWWSDSLTALSCHTAWFNVHWPHIYGCICTVHNTSEIVHLHGSLEADQWLEPLHSFYVGIYIFGLDLPLGIQTLVQLCDGYVKMCCNCAEMQQMCLNDKFFIVHKMCIVLLDASYCFYFGSNCRSNLIWDLSQIWIKLIFDISWLLIHVHCQSKLIVDPKVHMSIYPFHFVAHYPCPKWNQN